MSTQPSLAQSFHVRHSAYFFEDAHYLVEAAATTEAREVSPCRFQFPDGSELTIDHRACRVTSTAAPVAA